MKTVIGMYSDMQSASAVVNDLINAGFIRTDITVMANKSGGGIGAIGASDTALTELGASAEQVRSYMEGVSQGSVVVTVKVADEQASQASSLMERAGIIDIRGGGQQRVTQDTSTRKNPTRTDDLNDETIEVIEENIQIGKRNVETGGVRVNTYIREVPVEEEVRLREETVHVERRPVDRPASTADLDTLREKTIEMTESREEAVVAKDARVVEEIRINKDVEERTETVRDTVRKTEVEVEQLDGTRSGTASRYEAFDSGFRTHWQNNYAKSGTKYDDYQPAYRYGYTLANDKRYSGRTWNEIESDVRRDWESQNQGPWEKLKDSIRYSWEQMSGKA